MSFPPLLSQSVQYGEQYVSRGLNRKFSGIFPSGIYRGFVLKPSAIPMHITVSNSKDWDASVAIVERDGYSLTITMRDAGDVQIPSIGEWYICIEALYSTDQLGHQRIVVRAKDDIEKHHVILGRVAVTSLDETTIPISPIMIDDKDRMTCNPVGTLNPKARAEIDIVLLNQADLARKFVTLSNRITKVEIDHANGGVGIGNANPGGYETPEGAIVAPITLIKEGGEPIKGAALTMIIAKNNLP